MWTTEHSIEAPGRAEAILRVWANVLRWGEWNPELGPAISADFPEVLAALVGRARG
jgi:hypothetical protein